MVQESFSSMDPEGLDAAADAEVERVFSELTAVALASAPAAIAESHGAAARQGQEAESAEGAGAEAEAEDEEMRAIQARLQNL